MKKNMTWITVSICALFLVTACEFSEYGSRRDWEDCDDSCYDYWDYDDQWDDDYWENDDDYNFCNDKLECLDECTTFFESNGDGIEVVWCYDECFFSFDECSPDEQTYEDQCDGYYGECMDFCYQEAGCANSQMECYQTCEYELDECNNSDDTSGDTSGDTSSDTSDDPSCVDKYDSCVDACSWDQEICHETCYEEYYGCMKDQTTDDTCE